MSICPWEGIEIARHRRLRKPPQIGIEGRGEQRPLDLVSWLVRRPEQPIAFRENRSDAPLPIPPRYWRQKRTEALAPAAREQIAILAAFNCDKRLPRFRRRHPREKNPARDPLGGARRAPTFGSAGLPKTGQRTRMHRKGRLRLYPGIGNPNYKSPVCRENSASEQAYGICRGN